MAVAPPTKRVTSKEMIIKVQLDTVNHEPKLGSVEFVDSTSSTSLTRDLPKVGEDHPDGGGFKVGKEKGTLTAAVFAQIKWHQHNPDCITFEIGGDQYQICF